MEKRTGEEIVRQTNALARSFYGFMGYMTTEAFRFDKATHPQERMCWNMAAHAQAVLRDTDVENALAELSEPPHAGLQRQDVEQRLAMVLTDECAIRSSEIAPQVTFRMLGLDSLDQVELFMAIEAEFSIVIKDKEASEWSADTFTLADLVDVITGKLNGQK